MNYICILVNSTKSFFVLCSSITNFTWFPIVFPIISITINHHKLPFVPCCFPLNQHKPTSFPMFFTASPSGQGHVWHQVDCEWLKPGCVGKALGWYRWGGPEMSWFSQKIGQNLFQWIFQEPIYWWSYTCSPPAR